MPADLRAFVVIACATVCHTATGPSFYGSEAAQGSASDVGSTQESPQRTKPSLHINEHSLAVHVAVAFATVVVHMVEAVTDKQPLESAVHVCRDPLLHVTPAAGHLLSHTQDAVPTVPEHVWPAGQAVGARYASHPCGSRPHVSSELGSEHCVWPIVHVLTHVDVQLAFGAGFEQTSPCGQGLVETTYGQRKLSVPHFASKSPWQAVPLPVQIEGWQMHVAVVPRSRHRSRGPQVVIGSQDVHPFVPIMQAKTPSAMHSVA